MKSVLYADRHTGPHHQPGHPERPERIEACLEALWGIDGSPVAREPREATQTELERVHSGRYLGQLEQFCRLGGGWIDINTYAGPGSFEVAVRAAGTCCLAVEGVLGEGPPAFCLVRPPGHHAGRQQAGGFCLLNNAAIAAAHALAWGAERVAIFDFDVHHGDGTQEVFWEDPRVLYLSTHQKHIFPGSGALREIGGGEGIGTTVNVPLSRGSTDADYLAIFDRLVRPVAQRFHPSLVVVSAGFDAHQREPNAEMDMTTEGYAALAHRVGRLAEELCRGRQVWILEGGYDLDALGDSWAASMEAVSGKGGEEAGASASLSSDVSSALAFHGSRWGLGGIA